MNPKKLRRVERAAERPNLPPIVSIEVSVDNGAWTKVSKKRAKELRREKPGRVRLKILREGDKAPRTDF